MLQLWLVVGSVGTVSHFPWSIGFTGKKTWFSVWFSDERRGWVMNAPGARLLSAGRLLDTNSACGRRGVAERDKTLTAPSNDAWSVQARTTRRRACMVKQTTAAVLQSRPVRRLKPRFRLRLVLPKNLDFSSNFNNWITASRYLLPSVSSLSKSLSHAYNKRHYYNPKKECRCYVFAAGMVKTITGGARITYHAEGPDGDAWEADFTPPFKKLDLMKGLETELNVKLPDPATLHTEGFLHSDCCSYSFVSVLSIVVLIIGVFLPSGL